MKGVTLPTETVFVMEMSPIKFGLGATEEIAHDARRLGLGKVLIITDRTLAELGLPSKIAGLLGEEGIKADVYDVSCARSACRTGSAVSGTTRDVPALIEGTLKQPRLLAGAPRTIGARELDLILGESMTCW